MGSKPPLQKYNKTVTQEGSVDEAKNIFHKHHSFEKVWNEIWILCTQFLNP
jgi:hypothetical protein